MFVDHLWQVLLNAQDGLLNAKILIVLSNDLELREKLSTALSYKSYQKLIKLCSNQGPNSTKTKQKKKTKTKQKSCISNFCTVLVYNIKEINCKHDEYKYQVIFSENLWESFGQL